MKTILLCGALSVMALMLIPSPQIAEVDESFVLLIDETAGPSVAEAKADSAGECVQLLTPDGSVETLDEADYLASVVLSEMPASFEPEALKAQAVAARTFLARQRLAGKHPEADVCAESGCCQAWSREDALQAKYGEDLPEQLEKAHSAVLETDGLILTYDGTPIDAVYFSCSGGSTEAAVAVWGTDVPYLQAVDSPGEQDALRYASQAVFSGEELAERLQDGGTCLDLRGPVQDWFGEAAYTEGGGVDWMEIGGTRVSGTELRKLLGLNSTKFTVSVTGETVCFQVLGFGHRVGMSQYGANAMAKLGFDYRAILQYYYRGAKIEQAPPTEAESA